MGLVLLEEEEKTPELLLSTMWGQSKKVVAYKPGRTACAGIFISDFPNKQMPVVQATQLIVARANYM